MDDKSVVRRTWCELIVGKYLRHWLRNGITACTELRPAQSPALRKQRTRRHGILLQEFHESVVLEVRVRANVQGTR